MAAALTPTCTACGKVATCPDMPANEPQSAAVGAWRKVKAAINAVQLLAATAEDRCNFNKNVTTAAPTTAVHFSKRAESKRLLQKRMTVPRRADIRVANVVVVAVVANVVSVKVASVTFLLLMRTSMIEGMATAANAVGARKDGGFGESMDLFVVVAEDLIAEGDE